MRNEYQVIEGKLFLSKEFLVSKGLKERTLNNYLSLYKNKKSSNFEFFKDPLDRKKWVFHGSIPKKTLIRFGIEVDSDMLIQLLKNDIEEQLNETYVQIWSILKKSWERPYLWKQYIPHYVERFIDPEIRRIFAKTHSVFASIIELKNEYRMIDILTMYLKLDSVVFRTENYNYFCQKINLASRRGIAEVLVHDFRIFGRSNYKLSDFVKKRIKFYYSVPKRYSFKKIHFKVNEELIEKGLQTISYSTVTKFLSNPYIRNQCDILRYGEGYSKQKLQPYLSRKEPRYLGEALQVDSTVLNIHSIDEHSSIIRLTFCAVMDVFSRQIIGYSFATSENSVMILEALKKAFCTFRIIPREILWDNHKAYYSAEFHLFKECAEEYGINIRSARVGNARDKGHIEKFFDILQSRYLVDAVGSLGAGVKARGTGNRIHPELERLYYQKKNIRGVEDTKRLMISLIERYNDDMSEKKKTNTPHKSLKFQPHDIAKIFFKSSTIKVARSKIKLRVNKNQYEYTVRNDILSERINNTKVIVRFNEIDMSEVFLFEQETNIYLGKLEIDYLINLVASEHDKKVINAHNEMIKKRIKNQVYRLLEEFNDGNVELKSLPTQLHNSEESLKRLLQKTEDELLIVDMLPTNNRGDRAHKNVGKQVRGFKNISGQFFKKKHKTTIINK